MGQMFLLSQPSALNAKTVLSMRQLEPITCFLRQEFHRRVQHVGHNGPKPHRVLE